MCSSVAVCFATPATADARGAASVTHGARAVLGSAAGAPTGERIQTGSQGPPCAIAPLKPRPCHRSGTGAVHRAQPVAAGERDERVDNGCSRRFPFGLGACWANSTSNPCPSSPSSPDSCLLPAPTSTASTAAALVTSYLDACGSVMFLINTS